MKLSPIVEQLRKFAPTFRGDVIASIEVEDALESVKGKGALAIVVPGAVTAEASPNRQLIRQELSEEFSVFAQVKTGNERGAQAIDALDDIRRELCLTLVGWTFDDFAPIQLVGFDFEECNRGFTLARFDFSTTRQLGRNDANDPAETWQEREEDGLPALEAVHINVDVVDPIANPLPGPDGHIEFQTEVKL